jgi:hypothetical protein
MVSGGVSLSRRASRRLRRCRERLAARVETLCRRGVASRGRGRTRELADEEMYPGDAQWSGLYDRMHTHEPDEIERRLALAAESGEGFAE